MRRGYYEKIANSEENREKCLKDLDKFAKKISAISGAKAVSAPKEERLESPLHKDIAIINFEFDKELDWSHRISISLYEDDCGDLAYMVDAEIYFGAIDLIGYSGEMTADGLYSDIDVAIAKVSNLFKKEATFKNLVKEYEMIDEELARYFFRKDNERTEILSQQRKNVLKRIRSLLI